MTAAFAPLEPITIVSSMPGTGLPTWEIDWLRIVAGASTDSLGRRWTVARMPDGEKGWSNPPGTRTNRDDRPDGDGSFRSRAYRKERLITLSGSVHCPSAAVREQTEAELSALCGDGGQLYTYRRITDTFDQVVDVELDDEPIIDPITMQRVDWSFRFAAPDPRKHDYRWREPRASPATGGVPGGGLNYSSGGLNYGGGGLNYGLPSPGSGAVPATVGNFGTADAAPFFILTGSNPSCSIARDETGQRLDYLGDIDIGETVWINCDEFPTRGVPAQSAMSSTRGDVTSLLVVQTGWPVIAAQDVGTFRLIGSGPPESLTVAFRSAWK